MNCDNQSIKLILSISYEIAGTNCGSMLTMKKGTAIPKIALAFWCFLFILTSGVMTLQQTLSVGQDRYVTTTSNFEHSHTTHSPILIDTNSDFLSQGFPGNGSSVNPYRISNLSITTTEVCIRIQDTTAHFIISDCILSGGTANNGIELSYVDNGVIMNNTIFQKNYGIQTNHASHVTFFNNTVFDNAFVGIYIYEYSHSNEVMNNTLSGNFWAGVYLSQSCANNIVKYNTLLENTQAGVALLACVDNFVEFNSIVDNADLGVHISGSHNTTVANNTISGSGLGIRVHSGDKNKIVNNTITENGQGVTLTSTADNNSLYLNIIAYNGNNNATDDGEYNNWNSTTCGNYWSDYIGTDVYTIPGGAGSIDYHPFSYDIRAPTIDHPDDVEYVEGSTGNSITWNATDFHPSHYQILDNGIELIVQSWSGESITVMIDDFDAGIHSVTITVYDTFGNYVADTVIVNVTPQPMTSTTPTTAIGTTPNTNTEPSFDTTTLLLIGAGVGVAIVFLVVLRSRRS
jgi:parallel beta-helix repeat protein